jgi:hypothetical protein
VHRQDLKTINGRRRAAETESTMKTMKRKKAKAVGAPAVENVTNDDARTVTKAMLGVGDCHAQGDLYFVRIGTMPISAKPRGNRQLADGNTQGSRHVCAIGEVFDADAGEVQGIILAATKGRVNVGLPYVGPIVRTADGRALIEHPEHGDHDYRGDVVLACVFQRSVDQEEREARVAD